MSDLRFIFVHGLSGWGSYDQAYRRMPYWGMRGGDLIAFLREKGYDAYAASVAPRAAPGTGPASSTPSWRGLGWTTGKPTATGTVTGGTAGISQAVH